MRAIKKLFIVFLCCVLASCANDAAQQQALTLNAQNTQKSTGGKWATAELEGSTWQLVDDKHVENMSFYPKGYLPITIGIKTASGPIIIAPVFHWAIDNDGVLVIEDTHKQVYKKIIKIADSEESVTVEVNGNQQYYRKLK